VKIDVGSAVPLHQELTTTIKGRDLITGLPRKAVLSSEEVRAAIQEPLSAIVEAVRLTLEETPPELAEDAMERGITVTGGGALLRGIDRLISKEATVPAHLAKDPLSSVVNGAGIMVEAVHGSARMRRMLERSSRP
jgi:rod shape-determining protein MreB